MIQNDVFKILRVPDDWADLILTKHGDKLSHALTEINWRSPDITPDIGMIMEPFRCCARSKVKVIILGQDPYPKKCADGLCFSQLPNTKTCGSMKNIKLCLEKRGFTVDANAVDLHQWAAQGVLLLNTALTTCVGKKALHVKAWKNFVTNILMDITPAAIIVLGKTAAQYAPYIGRTTTTKCFEWAHPSPQTTINNKTKDGSYPPGHFIHCDVFNRCNDHLAALGLGVVDWSIYGGTPADVEYVDADGNLVANPDEDASAPVAVVLKETDGRGAAEVASELFKELLNKRDQEYERLGIDDTDDLDVVLWIFTDGSYSSRRCVAGVGVHVVETQGDALKVVCQYDASTSFTHKATNNRAEMAGCLAGLYLASASTTKSAIVSDSQYALKTTAIWYPAWIKVEGGTTGKQNIDMCELLYAVACRTDAHYWGTVNDQSDDKDLLSSFDRGTPLVHTRGHIKYDATRARFKEFIRSGNHVVDKLASVD